MPNTELISLTLLFKDSIKIIMSDSYDKEHKNLTLIATEL